jgi:hypothetical protein
MLFRQQLGLGLAKAHGPAFAAALHTVHEINPHPDQQQERQPQHKRGEEARLLLWPRFNRDIGGQQALGKRGIIGADGGILLPIAADKDNPLAINGHAADIGIFNAGNEL